MGNSPFSLIIPVQNEAQLLPRVIPQMVKALTQLGRPYEIFLCENGSTDETLSMAQELQRRYPDVTVAPLPKADYGLALKHAILACRHETAVIVNADFWDAAFIREALRLLETCDLVVGSKMLTASKDERPLLRKLITGVFNQLLRWLFKFRGTDTHGMKALRRSALATIVSRCVTDHFLFDTELVLRTQREGLRIVEIPVQVRELRPPSWGSLVQRIPAVLQNLVRLWRVLR